LLRYYTYYSNAFPMSQISKRPENVKVIYDDQQLCKIIDFLMFKMDVKANEDNIPIEFTFKQPAHILVGEFNDNLNLAICWSKAMRGNTIMPWMLEKNPNMNYSAIHELGVKIDIKLDVSIADINKYYDYWEKLFEYDDYLRAANNMIMLKSQPYIYDVATHRDKSIDNEKLSELKQYDDSFEKMLNDIYSQYKSQVERKLHIIKIDPIFQAKDMVVDDKLVFGILPFNDDRLNIFDEMITPRLKDELGLDVLRSGKELVTNTGIMEKIWQRINEAKFVIVDISDMNANVFYELGICHTLGKQTIIICDNESRKNDYDNKIPFDIASIPVIFYTNKGNYTNEMVDTVVKTASQIIGKDND